MKYLFYFSIILLTILIFSCKDNSITPTQNDPNLLFSYDELACDFLDSVRVNDSTYYFNAGLWFYADTTNISKIKITCVVSCSFDSIGTYGYYSFAIKHRLDSTTFGDTINEYPHPPQQTNQSYTFLYNIIYPTNYGFSIEIITWLYPNTNYFNQNPKHTDFIRLKNIKVYKVN